MAFRLFRRRKSEIDLGGRCVGPAGRDSFRPGMKGNRARTEQLCLRESTVLPAGEVVKEDGKRNRHVDANLTCLALIPEPPAKPPGVVENRRPLPNPRPPT